MTHLYRTECRHCGTELGYLDHCCPNPECGKAVGTTNVVSLDAARERERARLEQQVAERWAGPTADCACGQCVDCVESDLRIAAKRKPYATNPQRRLRRIKRWVAKCNKIAPPVCKWLYPRTVNGRRILELNRMIAAELEWACKTAMTAVGGEW